MRKVDMDRTKAFFDIETKNFIIYQCRLVQADSGRLIIHLPYRQYTVRGKKIYDPIIRFKDVDYIEALSEEAIKTYNAIKSK